MKHLYISEITGEQYDSEEACTKADEEFLAKREAEKQAAEAKATARKERAAEVNKAFAELQDAHKRYTELRNQFIEDFGSYHQTFFTKEPVDSWEYLVRKLVELL